MDYTPDRWIVIKVNSPTDSVEKVLAGWYGGFTEGDFWKLNSGNEEVIDKGDHYVFKGYSGSEYICYKNRYGLTGLTSSILEHFKKTAPEGCTLEIVKKYNNEKENDDTI